MAQEPEPLMRGDQAASVVAPVRGRRVGVSPPFRGQASNSSATSKSPWSQAWWNAIRILSDSRRV